MTDTNRPPSPVRTYLEERRKVLLAALRSKDKALTDEFIEVDTALRAMDATEAESRVRGDWSRYRKAIDAVETFLDRDHKPEYPNTIAKALRDGGFAADAKRPLFNVLDSIRYHLKGNDSRLLELPDGRIALRRWTSPQPVAKGKK